MSKKWALVRFQYEEAHRKAVHTRTQFKSIHLDTAIKYLEHSWTLLSKGEWAKAVVQAQSARDEVMINIANTSSVTKIEMLIMALSACDEYLMHLRGYGAERIKHVA